MKSGADNRKKTIAAAALGTVALGLVGYMLVSQFGVGSSPTPAPAAPATSSAISQRAETIKSASNSSSTASANAQAGSNAGQGPVPGADATLVAKTRTSLDPTLDETGMLRTESLVYSGTGRNIFSLIYVPPPPPLPNVAPKARPGLTVNQGPVTPPPYVPPPIPLKFFGTLRGGTSPLRAWILNGDDVFLASQGDIVAHKYKIDNIGASSIQVEDLSNHNKQTLPLQMQ